MNLNTRTTPDEVEHQIQTEYLIEQESQRPISQVTHDRVQTLRLTPSAFSTDYPDPHCGFGALPAVPTLCATSEPQVDDRRNVEAMPGRQAKIEDLRKKTA